MGGAAVAANTAAGNRSWTRNGDVLGVGAVVAVTVVAVAELLAGGTLVGQDSATQFYPWYGYLGEQLRQGEIPGWTPFQFAGAPFAADPQSGWTYLPAMVLFTLLPLALAVPAFLAFHLALAGLGTYALGRALGMPAMAAAVAAVSYELTGPVYGRSVCCPAAMEVATWTPAALLGVELAIRAVTPLARLRGWSIAGLAISQGLAAWLGQGAYYLLLAVAGFIVYRTLLSPPVGSPPLVQRLRAATTHGIAVVGIGFGLGAAGVLPRLAYVDRSSVSGGEYDGASSWAAEIGGATPASVFDRLLFPNLHYPGAATVALTLVALLLARGRFAAPYFALLTAAGMVLASPRSTPLHEVLYVLLPRFEELHRHWPERVSLVIFLGPALLAGAAVGTLIEADGHVRQRLPLVVVPVAALVAVRGIGAGVPIEAFVAVGAVAALLAALLAAPAGLPRQALPALLVVVIAIDLIGANRVTAQDAPYGGFHRLDVGDYYAPSGAARFLQAATADQPARFLGYDPALRSNGEGRSVLYRDHFADPRAVDLLVNNRATVLGLHDVQGYNPVQVDRYVEFLNALNGHSQDYHDANVYESGLDSPLLDLLNVRYVVVPARPPAEREDFRWLVERWPTVYLDSEVRVLANPGAMPRAWIVHEAIRVEAGEALSLLAAGTIDPRTTALLEEDPPPLAHPAEPAADRVRVVEHHADRLRLTAQTSAPGLLVLSEVYDPGWRAYVDGKAAPVLVANHALRAVPLPAGAHTVELRYESTMLWLGGTISLVTVAALLTTAAVLDRRRWVRLRFGRAARTRW